MVYAGVERLLNGLVRVLLGGLRERGSAEDEHGVLTAKTSQTTVFHAWSLSSLILSSFPFHSQRNHLERPHPEAHGTPMYLHGTFGHFEQIDALHALDGTTEAQRALPAGAVGFVEAQDRRVPFLRQLEAPERELQPLCLNEGEHLRQHVLLRSSGKQRRVEGECFARDPRGGPIALVG